MRINTSLTVAVARAMPGYRPWSSVPTRGFESYAVIGRILMANRRLETHLNPSVSTNRSPLIANFHVFFGPRDARLAAACTRASKLPTITGPPMKRRVNLRMNDADERTIRQQ